MKNIKNIFNAGTGLIVLFHFVICGLPVMLILIGSIFGIYVESPLGGYLGRQEMLLILIISGLMLSVSLIFYVRDCCCNIKVRKFNKISLIIAVLLYSLAVIGHFTSPHLTGAVTHEMASCH